MADCFEEYIDRWIFIAEKRKQYCVNCNRRKGMKNGKLRFCYDIGEAPCRACEINDMLNDVEDFPSADVAPVRHGRWLTKEYMYGDPDVGISDMWVDRTAEQSDYYAYCSFCGEDAGYNNDGKLILSNYCPSCGAIMDKEDTDGKTAD